MDQIFEMAYVYFSVGLLIWAVVFVGMLIDSPNDMPGQEMSVGNMLLVSAFFGVLWGPVCILCLIVGFSMLLKS